MSQIPRFSNSIGWLIDMISLLQGSISTVPEDYRTQVLSVKKLMQNDETGIISTLLDFAISSASDINLSVDTNNSRLTELLNNWLGDINGSLLGKIPIGIEALSKEYYRERWKGSSFLLLRTIWEEVDGFKLPAKMWFVDGEDIDVKYDNEIVTLGDEQYSIIIDPKYPKKNIKLPTNRNEKIFIQKPYNAWGTPYSTPFIIQRGLYKNALFLKTLMNKGEVVVAKALEYLMVIKKGTEALAKENRSEFIYSDEDLKAVKEQFGLLTNKRNTEKGTPSYITNFDTEIEHLIPEYERILKPTLYAPIEQRLLSGLGLVDITSVASSSRREGTLNPKAYIGELNSGISDFKQLMKDILVTIVIENQKNHPKYFSIKNSIGVRSTPVKAFMSDDYKTMLRSLYDRGVLSKRTFVEVVGETSYCQERDRRIQEAIDADDVILFPPIIQNLEQTRSPEEDTPTNIEDENKLDDRTGPEKDNFNLSSLEEYKCKCGEIFDFESQKEISVGSVECPKCKTICKKPEVSTKKNYEEAPYNKISELPDSVKNVMSKTLQKVWMDVFNKAYPKGEDYARKAAWNVIKKIAKKNKDGEWVKREVKGSLESEVAINYE